MLFGSLTYATLIGDIFQMLESLETSSQYYKEKIDQVLAYLKSINIDTDTRQKVLQYYSFKYPSGKYYNEDEILNELNSSLRSVRLCAILFIRF
jgi:hypothetical protein